MTKGDTSIGHRLLHFNLHPPVGASRENDDARGEVCDGGERGSAEDAEGEMERDRIRLGMGACTEPKSRMRMRSDFTSCASMADYRWSKSEIENRGFCGGSGRAREGIRFYISIWQEPDISHLFSSLYDFSLSLSRRMTVFSHAGTGGGFLAVKQVFPVDYKAEASKKLLDALSSGDLGSA